MHKWLRFLFYFFIFLDSRLVVSQVEGSFEVRDPWMAEYLKMVGTLLVGFQKAKVS